jgi:hypothetical protein
MSQLRDRLYDKESQQATPNHSVSIQGYVIQSDSRLKHSIPGTNQSSNDPMDTLIKMEYDEEELDYINE